MYKAVIAVCQWTSLNKITIIQTLQSIHWNEQ